MDAHTQADVAALLTAIKTKTLTSAMLMHVVIELAHEASAMTALPGAQKKALVIAALEALARQAPFPENLVLPVLVEAAAPAMIDAIVAGAAVANTRLHALLPLVALAATTNVLSWLWRQLCAMTPAAA